MSFIRGEIFHVWESFLIKKSKIFTFSCESFYEKLIKNIFKKILFLKNVILKCILNLQPMIFEKLKISLLSKSL